MPITRNIAITTGKHWNGSASPICIVRVCKGEYGDTMVIEKIPAVVNGARPAILIYRTALLSLSETFVLSQPKALKDFTPYFVGFTRVDGLQLPEKKFHIIDQVRPLSSVRKLMYRLFGFAPGLSRKLRRLNPV